MAQNSSCAERPCKSRQLIYNTTQHRMTVMITTNSMRVRSVLWPRLPAQRGLARAGPRPTYEGRASAPVGGTQ